VIKKEGYLKRKQHFKLVKGGKNSGQKKREGRKRKGGRSEPETPSKKVHQEVKGGTPVKDRKEPMKKGKVTKELKE